MKSELISIRPKWCELIASGKKTIEVRKTKPKIDTPFKCYIYCTQGKAVNDILTFAEYKNGEYMGDYYANGKVIGEFVCDRIVDCREIEGKDFYQMSQMAYEEWRKYTDDFKGNVYSWFILSPKIYDKPKELKEFRKYISFFDGESIEEFEAAGINNIRLKRPPQSWCYVEEV